MLKSKNIKEFKIFCSGRRLLHYCLQTCQTLQEKIKCYYSFQGRCSKNINHRAASNSVLQKELHYSKKKPKKNLPIKLQCPRMFEVKILILLHVFLFLQIIGIFKKNANISGGCCNAHNKEASEYLCKLSLSSLGHVLVSKENGKRLQETWVYLTQTRHLSQCCVSYLLTEHMKVYILCEQPSCR